MSAESNLSNPLHSIQALRGIAAMMVLLAHLAQAEARYAGEALLGQVWLNGFAGVDMFFCISGFIMVYCHQKGMGKPGAALAFGLARIIRIYPLWWLVSFLLMGYYLVQTGKPFDPDSLTHNKDAPLHYLLFSLALLPQADLPLLSLGWTLIHEIYFYAGFTILLLLPRTWLGYGLAVWASAVLIGTLTELKAYHTSHFVRLLFHPLSLEFLGGCALALIILYRPVFRPFSVLVIGLFGLVFGMAWLSLPALHFIRGDGLVFALGWGRVLAYGLPMLAIIYGLVGLELQARLPKPRLTFALGNISYALYLFHIPAIHTVGQRAQPWLIQYTDRYWDNIIYLFICLIASIGCAWIVHIMFERPVQSSLTSLRWRICPEGSTALK